MKNMLKPLLLMTICLIASKTLTMNRPDQFPKGNRQYRLPNSMAYESIPDPELDAINNMTPEQRAIMANQDRRLEVAGIQLDLLKQQAQEFDKTLSNPNFQPPLRGASVPTPIIDPAPIEIQSRPFLNRNSHNPSRLPEITPGRIALALAAIWAATEIGIAYKSFTREEKAQASAVKFPCLVGLRAAKNMLNRPAQVISLPCQAVAFLEKKLSGK